MLEISSLSTEFTKIDRTTHDVVDTFLGIDWQV
jgi:hypothetical protein